MLEPLAPGVALSAGEVVLDRRADPGGDPVLLLRAATGPPSTASSWRRRRRPAWCASARRCPTPGPRRPGTCWCGCSPPGQGLLDVWETLEETGALTGFLPEWERVRMLPHASVIHRFTVDRHVVETCVEASGLIRSVARPDVLMVAALLHDIGKGGLTEHSVAGEPIARAVGDPDGLRA